MHSRAVGLSQKLLVVVLGSKVKAEVQLFLLVNSMWVRTLQYCAAQHHCVPAHGLQLSALHMQFNTSEQDARQASEPGWANHMRVDI